MSMSMSMSMSMKLVDIINGRYEAAKDNLKEVYSAPPTTYKERYDYNKAIKAGRTPTKYTKATLQLARTLEQEQKYVNTGMNFIIEYIQEENEHLGGIYEELLRQIGQVDKKFTTPTYQEEQKEDI